MKGIRDSRSPESKIIWNPTRIGRFKPSHLELALQLEWAVATHTDYVKLSIDYWDNKYWLWWSLSYDNQILDDQESYYREPIALMSCDVGERGKADGAFWLIADYFLTQSTMGRCISTFNFHETGLLGEPEWDQIVSIVRYPSSLLSHDPLKRDLGPLPF